MQFLIESYLNGAAHGRHSILYSSAYWGPTSLGWGRNLLGQCVPGSRGGSVSVCQEAARATCLLIDFQG